MEKQRFSTEELIKLSYSQSNRREKPKATAPKTAQEYIIQKGDGFAHTAMQVGKVPGLGVKPGEFMGNKPAWLGEAPEIEHIDYEESCGVLVIGSGQAGTAATLRLAELGADVLTLEVQTWEEYDCYSCDMATYNSRFFLDRGAPYYEPMDIFNEYMRKSLCHAHPKLVRDYVLHSGEMLDWMLKYIPEELTAEYAHLSNLHGNLHSDGISCGQRSFIAMLQWRDNETNINMWPFVIRNLHTAAEKLGARHKYGAQAIRLLQDESGRVTGCIATDVDGKFFKINCKAVLVTAGDYGGNPDMLLDLGDLLRNLAWSAGMDRTDTSSVGVGGRDGSGIRMALWAGATMEVGPRAGQGGEINCKPTFPFGGVWPTFGPDGKRFTNETLMKHGPDGVVDMMRPEGIISIVTDANWDEYCEYQGYGHEVMDRSNVHMISKIREEMAAYKTGPEGFPVQMFAHFGKEYDTVYAADTLRELGEILGYTGDGLEGFLAEVEHWNEMCDKKADTDWGCDPNYMFPIRKAPFFGSRSVLSPQPVYGGLCQHAGVCTDGSYRVLYGDKTPIGGLYAAGNCCGQRYAVQYHTPTSGNSCGSALTGGYLAADYIVQSLR